MTHYKYFRCLISTYLLAGRERLQIKALAGLPVLMPGSLWTPTLITQTCAHTHTRTRTRNFAIASCLTCTSVCVGARNRVIRCKAREHQRAYQREGGTKKQAKNDRKVMTMQRAEPHSRAISLSCQNAALRRHAYE